MGPRAGLDGLQWDSNRVILKLVFVIMRISKGYIWLFFFVDFWCFPACLPIVFYSPLDFFAGCALPAFVLCHFPFVSPPACLTGSLTACNF